MIFDRYRLWIFIIFYTSGAGGLTIGFGASSQQVDHIEMVSYVNEDFQLRHEGFMFTRRRALYDTHKQYNTVRICICSSC